MTVEDAMQVTELKVNKLFALYLPSSGKEQLLGDAGNGNYSALHLLDINFSNRILGAEGRGKIRFIDAKEEIHPPTRSVFGT